VIAEGLVGSDGVVDLAEAADFDGERVAARYSSLPSGPNQSRRM
jgi:hypothetical protein